MNKTQMSLEPITKNDVSFTTPMMVVDLAEVFDANKMYDEAYIHSRGLKVNKGNEYVIVCYDRKSSEKYTESGLLRSVVYHHDIPVCYSPPKSSLVQHVHLNKEYKIEEYVDGTMINVFYHNNKWNISTRSIIDANTYFYNDIHDNKKTYKEMFEDCLEESKLKLDALDQNYCYSFVIKHPLNRIVEPVHKPMLYLCGVYDIQGSKVYEVPLTMIHLHNQEKTVMMNPELEIMFRNTYVRVPSVDIYHTIEEAIDIYASYKTPYVIKGFVIRIGCDRFKYINPNYSYVRVLRGNQSKLQYKYYELRQKQYLNEYLQYFPEHTNIFYTFAKELEHFEDMIYLFYREVHIYKRLNITDIPFEYRNHIKNIHQIYIYNLNNKIKNSSIQKKTVQKYTYHLHPAMMMFSINYNKRLNNCSQSMHTQDYMTVTINMPKIKV